MGLPPIIFLFTSNAFLAVPSGFFTCGASGAPYLPFLATFLLAPGTLAILAILPADVAPGVADSARLQPFLRYSLDSYNYLRHKKFQYPIFDNIGRI